MYTKSQQNASFLEQSSENPTNFYYFLADNIARKLKGYKFVNLTCKLLLHYLQKCKREVSQQYIIVIWITMPIFQTLSQQSSF